jgi:hypothetical protein
VPLSQAVSEADAAPLVPPDQLGATQPSRPSRPLGGARTRAHRLANDLARDGRTETLASLGTIAGGAFLMLTTSLKRVLGQIAFATGLYSPRLGARLLSRPIVAWSAGLFVSVLVCASNAGEREQAMTPDRQGIGASSSREPQPVATSHVTV